MPKPLITRFSSVDIEPSSTNRDNGLYIPRLTEAQKNIIPADVIHNGCIIYNITDNEVQVYKNGAWTNINTGGGGGGGGDVTGPAGAVDNNIATFDLDTGKIIKDSGVSITQVPVLLSSKISKITPFLVNVNEISNLGHIRFTNNTNDIGIGLIFVDSLMPVEFITNDFGPDFQVCSLFTGGFQALQLPHQLYWRFRVRQVLY